jgi:hypothetical protein
MLKDVIKKRLNKKKKLEDDFFYKKNPTQQINFETSQSKYLRN